MPEHWMEDQQRGGKKPRQTTENPVAEPDKQTEYANAAGQRQDQQDTLRPAKMQPVQHAHL
jgi:hypothetical protein